MIGFLVTMENIYRNEHITPVFKIIISNPNYWNLAAGYASTWTCRLSIASEIPEMSQNLPIKLVGWNTQPNTSVVL